jgi:hypothetical protein
MFDERDSFRPHIKITPDLVRELAACQQATDEVSIIVGVDPEAKESK